MPDFYRQIRYHTDVQSGEIITDSFDYTYVVVHVSEQKMKVYSIRNPEEITIIPFDGILDDQESVKFWRCVTSTNYKKGEFPPKAAHSIQYDDTKESDFNDDRYIRVISLTNSMIESIVSTLASWLYNNVAGITNDAIYNVLMRWVKYDQYALRMPIEHVIKLCKSNASTINDTKDPWQKNKAKVLRALAYKLESDAVDAMLKDEKYYNQYPYIWDIDKIEY